MTLRTVFDNFPSLFASTWSSPRRAVIAGAKKKSDAVISPLKTANRVCDTRTANIFLTRNFPRRAEFPEEKKFSQNKMKTRAMIARAEARRRFLLWEWFFS
jgi:hypothetical protein